MATAYQVYAEVGTDGGALLFSFDPPGLAGHGASVAEALEQARTRGIAELLSMAATAGRALVTDGRSSPWPVPAPAAPAVPGQPQAHSLVVVETKHRRGPVANGNTTATFGPDLVPLAASEVPALLELLAESRRRLLAWRPILETAPEAAKLLRFRSLPHRKSVAEQLAHVAATERWYLTRICPPLPPLPRLPRSHNHWERLDSVRWLVVRSLSGLDPQQLAVEHRVQGELWTARKVVRRLLYHEQFHRETLTRDLRLAMSRPLA